MVNSPDTHMNKSAGERGSRAKNSHLLYIVEMWQDVRGEKEVWIWTTHSWNSLRVRVYLCIPNVALLQHFTRKCEMSQCFIVTAKLFCVISCSMDATGEQKAKEVLIREPIKMDTSVKMRREEGRKWIGARGWLIRKGMSCRLPEEPQTPLQWSPPPPPPPLQCFQSYSPAALGLFFFSFFHQCLIFLLSLLAKHSSRLFFHLRCPVSGKPKSNCCMLIRQSR